MYLFKHSRVVFFSNSIGFVNIVHINFASWEVPEIIKGRIFEFSFATRSILSRDLRVICLPSKSHFFFRSRLSGGNITCTLYLLLYTLYLIPHTPYFTLHTAYRVIYDPFGYLLFSSFSKRFDWLEIVTRERSQNIPS